MKNPLFNQPDKNHLNGTFGFTKVQSHLKGAGRTPLYNGRIVGIEDSMISFFIPETIEDISNYFLGHNNGVSPTHAKKFAKSILDKEYKQMKSNNDSFIALTNTPFGMYVSYCV